MSFNAQKYVSTGDLAVTPYNRRDYYKIWLLVGKSKLHYADRSVDITRPALIFSNPLVSYALESHASRRTGYTCIFTEDFLKVWGRMDILQQSTLFKPGSDKVFFLDKTQLETVKRIFEEMLEELKTDYAFRYDVLRNYVHLLIHLSLKIEPGQANPQPTNAAARIAAQFLDLLEGQFPVYSPDRELQLKRAGDFAQALSIHVNHLNHAVKEVTGKSPSVLISERIINEAKALLKYSDWSVSDIAFSLGFEYPTYFNQFFKKNTGVTPLSLRK